MTGYLKTVVRELLTHYPSAYESVAKARRAIVAFAREWFQGEALTDIESAVGEALANSAEHGHRDGGQIHIRCRFADDRLSIEITDAGCGFDRWATPGFDRPLAHTPRGFGVYIMGRLMDEITYTENGRRLQLVKRRAAGWLRARAEHKSSSP